MHAALDVNLPNYASSIVNAAEIVASISALEEFSAGSGQSGSGTVRDNREEETVA